MPTILSFARRVALSWLLAGAACHALAQAPPHAPASPAPADTAFKETSVSANSFARGVPLPAWADALPLPAPTVTRRAVAVRLDDTHLLVAERPVLLVNAAQQVNDASVLGQIGQIALQFIPQYQRLVLHKVAIVRDGRPIDHTLSAPVRFLQRESGLEQGLYSGVITATLLLPDVRVGDTLHLQYSVEGANPIFGARYVQGTLWQRTLPVDVRRVTLNAPEARSIPWKWVGDGALPQVEPTTTTRNGMRRTRFEARELPGIEPEPLLPRGAQPLPVLQFSEFADWAEVARWAEGLFPSDEPLPPELLPLMHRLLRMPSRAEQASAALQWVQSEIRYYSVSLGESSHRPHRPAEVLRNRYGDCKDKSFLLMRILQSLGIPARAVLASLGAPQGPDRQLASPLAFDHAVVQARIDGRDYFLDPTRLGQQGPLDRMGQGLEGARVLVVDARETTALATVQSPNRAELFRSELNEKFTVTGFGDEGELETRQQWNGLGAELMRLTMARFDAPRLQRSVLAGLEPRYPGATLVGAPEFTDEPDRNRITLRARFKIPKLTTAVDGFWLLRFTPFNMQGTFAIPASTARQQPLALPAFPVAVFYNAEVQWPANVAATDETRSQRFDTPQFRSEVTRSFRGNVSRVTLQFEPLAAAVPAVDVPVFIDEARKLDRAASAPMLLARHQVREGAFAGTGRKTVQEALAARLQDTVQRSTKAISSGQLAGDDLATALCFRAQARYEMGELPGAATDAQEAVRLAPTLSLAWMCRGNVNWARGDFAAATADVTKALALGQPAAESYFRRGHARFYEGRFELAADDFAKAAERSEAGLKPYAQLWQAWSLQRLGQPVPAELAAADPAGDWPRPALALAAGRITPEQLLEHAERKPGPERDATLAEAWFFIGQQHLALGQPARAREAFEKCRALGITNYVEHMAAGFELQRLR